MRIVWKDTGAWKRANRRYRKHTIYGQNGGWATDIPGDENIYKTLTCALNAIDKALGGYGQQGYSKRTECGIQIIGKKDGETA